MSLTVVYDAEADAAFIRVSGDQSVETVAATETINLDFDADGRLVAIEVLDVSKTAPALLTKGKEAAVAAE